MHLYNRSNSLSSNLEIRMLKILKHIKSNVNVLTWFSRKYFNKLVFFQKTRRIFIHSA